VDFIIWLDRLLWTRQWAFRFREVREFLGEMSGISFSLEARCISRSRSVGRVSTSIYASHKDISVELPRDLICYVFFGVLSKSYLQDINSLSQLRKKKWKLCFLLVSNFMELYAFEKMLVAQQVNKLPNFMEHEGPFPCSQVHRTSLRSILILYSHQRISLPAGLCPSGFRANILYVCLISPCYMPRLSHIPWFAHANSIWWNLLIMQFSSDWCCYLLARSKYSSQHLILKHPPSVFNVRDQVSHTYKSTGKIIVLYILIFRFVDTKTKDKII
jgi:hypothetical protein